MFDGMKLVDGISPLKRISLSVWCDARPRAEQERLPFGYDAPYGDTIAAKVARYPLAGAGERLRAQQREAEHQTEMLFQSLLNEAFKS